LLRRFYAKFLNFSILEAAYTNLKKSKMNQLFQAQKKLLDSDKLVDLPNLLTSGCSGGGVNATCG
jgi:hypothetical protein